MPMRLCIAPDKFQTLMNYVFRDVIDDFIEIYMDELLIFSKNLEDHYKHLQLVSSRLKEHLLYLLPKRCKFMQKEVECLGLIVRQDGIKIDPEKCRAIKE